MLNTPRGQTVRARCHNLPLSLVSLASCHAPSLTVPQLVEAEENVQEELFQRLWIDSRLEAWNSHKAGLREKRMQFKQMLSQDRFVGEFVVEGGLCPLDVANVHDADGLGAPLCANFSFEDWVISCFGELNSTLLHMVSSLAMLVLVVFGSPSIMLHVFMGW